MTASWEGRVTFDASGGAYRPHQLLIHAADLSEALRVLAEQFGVGEPGVSEEPVLGYVLVTATIDVPLAADVLTSMRLRAQPNHVLFADAGWPRPLGAEAGGLSGNPFSGNPFSGNPFSGNPFSGNPFSGNPFSGNPFSGNPFSGNPFSGNPFSGVAYGSPDALRDRAFSATGRGPNLARPTDPMPARGPRPSPTGWPGIGVLDVGLPDAAALPGMTPYMLQDCRSIPVPLGPGVPSDDDDGLLDRIAGHGMFVAGRIAQVHPDSFIEVVSVLNNAGDGDELQVAQALEALADRAEVDVVNLSFGGYEVRHMRLLRKAILTVQSTHGPVSQRAAAEGWTYQNDDHGIVVVVSAGNDASPVAPYPAAFPGVVSVAALGPFGPATFTNYGPWVRACACGVDVASTFFQGFNGDCPVDATGDPDDFKGAATWSGTSFAAPLVAGKIARVVREQRLLPKSAVRQLLDAPGLARLPGLGTIVT
jgi:Subtilase family